MFLYAIFPNTFDFGISLLLSSLYIPLSCDGDVVETFSVPVLCGLRGFAVAAGAGFTGASCSSFASGARSS